MEERVFSFKYYRMDLYVFWVWFFDLKSIKKEKHTLFI